MRIIVTAAIATLLSACTSAPPSTASGMPRTGFEDIVALARGGQPYVIPEENRNAYHIVTPGSVYTVALDKQLRIAAVMGGEAPPNPPVTRPESDDPTRESLEAVRGPASLKALSDRIEFTLWSTRRDGTVLMIRNGESKPIVYLAAIIHGAPVPENFELTTICSVGGKKVNFEHWYEPIDGIAILKILDPPPSDTPICVDPTENYDNPRWYKIDE